MNNEFITVIGQYTKRIDEFKHHITCYKACQPIKYIRLDQIGSFTFVTRDDKEAVEFQLINDNIGTLSAINYVTFDVEPFTRLREKVTHHEENTDTINMR